MQSVASSMSKNPFLSPNGSSSRSLPSFPDSKSNYIFINPIKSRHLSLFPQTITFRGKHIVNGPPKSPSAFISSRLFIARENPISALSQMLSIEIWSGTDRLAMAKLNGVKTAFFLAVCFSSISSSASASTPEEAFVRKTVSSHDIVIFSKSYCPYCERTKAVFEELKKTPYVVELDQRDDGGDIQDALKEIVGRRSVPQVFIRGKHIGDSDDTVGAYKSGTLAKLLGDRSDNL